LVDVAFRDIAASVMVFWQRLVIECGMKPLESGLSSSVAERFHYSGLNKALRIHAASKAKFLSG
jgi:hypothetical protein